MTDQQLTAVELVQLEQAIRLEERLACLFAKGAEECAQPQLRSFFAHQSERNGERLGQLSGVLQSLSGGAVYPEVYS